MARKRALAPKRKATSKRVEPAPLSDELPETEGDPSVEELEVEASSELPNAAGPEDEGEEVPNDSDQGEAPSNERALVRHDPLAAYMHEVRRYPLLTREEELALAVRYFEHGDLVAARRLVESNLRLVVKIAHGYNRAHRNLLDLVQEGNVGLMQAVRKYDPYRGVKLSSYAAWWIRAYILKFIVSNWRLVKIGTTQAQRKLFFNLNKEKEKLEKEGFVSETSTLAKRLKVSEQEVTEMNQRLASQDLSLNQPASRDDADGPSHLDRVEGGERPDAQVENREFSELLQDLLQAFGKELTGREKTLFDKRMLNDSPMTLQEIADRYRISRERARQIEARLKIKLEKYLREKLGDTIDLALESRE